MMKKEETEFESSLPMLSGKDASRILDNVFAICGLPPCKIPFEVLEEKVKSRAEKERKETIYG